MGMLDGLLGQISDQVDVENLAKKLGLDPEQVTKAVSALAQAHFQQGDTATLAAENTGLSVDTIKQVIEHIGGEGSIERYAQMLKDDQGLLGQAGNLAAGLFGKD